MQSVETFRGGLQLKTAPEVFPTSTDSILLADFVRLTARARICDLGCGSGILGLLLCSRQAGSQLTAIDLSAHACTLTAENVQLNELQERCSVLQGDICEIRAILPANSMTHVISNPPYFDAQNPTAPVQMRALARSEQSCTITAVCDAAAWLLTYGGTFSLIYRPERLCDLFCALRAARLEPKRIRFVRHHADAPVSLVLLEAKQGGKPGLTYLPDFILHTPDGAPSAELAKLYQREGDSSI